MSDTYPVVEVFGPTIQGEGSLSGQPSLFVRLAGCDFRCKWCDTNYANQNPETRQECPDEIFYHLEQLIPSSTRRRPWVTITGGNPLLYDLDPLLRMLHGARFPSVIETQGSILRRLTVWPDLMVVSPKPPSSGMAQADIDAFVHYPARGALEIKVVVFDDDDFDFARQLRRKYHREELFSLSVGTPPGSSREEILERTRWLTERAIADETMLSLGFEIHPQMHVLLWGSRRGV